MGQAGFEQQKCEAHEMIQGAASGQRQTTGHWNDLDCANPVCKNTMWPPIAKLLDVSIQDVSDFVWLGLFAQTATSWPVSASQARHDKTYCRTQVCVTVILVNVAPLKCNASSFYQPDMSWQSWCSNGHPILTILRLLGLERKKTRHAKLYQGSSAHKKSLVLITKTTDAPAAWLRAPVSMTKVLTTECMNSWPILRQVWREINSTDLFLCCQIGAEKKNAVRLPKGRPCQRRAACRTCGGQYPKRSGISMDIWDNDDWGILATYCLQTMKSMKLGIMDWSYDMLWLLTTHDGWLWMIWFPMDSILDWMVLAY